MRNIRIADRKDWVFEAPPPRPPARAPRSRMRDWLATLPIILLVPVLIVPFAATMAGSPRLRASDDTVEPGERVRIRGNAFNRDERGRLFVALDGKPIGEALDSYHASRKGEFSIRVRLPRSLEAGEYDVIAMTRGSRVRATVTVEVVVDDDVESTEATPPPADPTTRPEPTATATATPTATATATASASATPTPTATATATATPTATATAAPTTTATAQATLAPVPTPSATPTATATATPSATATATAPPPPPSGPPSSSGPGILMSAADVDRLPMSGSAWAALKSRADGSVGSPDISNQDEGADMTVLAKALVWARTDALSYRTAALAGIKAAVGTEAGGRTLALGRNLPGYVIAADLISLSTLDPSYDQGTFRPWLRSLLSKDLDGMTLRETHEDRPNNWGTHAGAARAAIAAYLGDTAELARTATVFRGWLGDRSAYAGFSYGDVSWQCDPAKPVGVNPSGCSRNGIVIDGALPDDMRRGGGLQWPPSPTGYAWEAMQGAVLQAELLRRAGYAAWDWSDKAMLRATRFLFDRAGWEASGDDEWQPWLLDRRYATSYRGAAPTSPGKNFGYTDWLYGS